MCTHVHGARAYVYGVPMCVVHMCVHGGICVHMRVWYACVRGVCAYVHGMHVCMVHMCEWCMCGGTYVCGVCAYAHGVHVCAWCTCVPGACVCMGHAQVDLSLLDSSREMNGLFLRSGNDRQRALANTSGVNPGAARLPVLALDPVAGGGAPQGPHAAGTASVGHLVIGVSMKTSLQAWSKHMQAEL